MNNQMIDGLPRDYLLHLTPDAYSVLLGMVEHCLNIRVCMGMDEGIKDFDTEEEHDFVKELRALLTAPVVEREPVAVVIATGGPHDEEDRVLVELYAELPPAGTKLYAAQLIPAPKKCTQCRQYECTPDCPGELS